MVESLTECALIECIYQYCAQMSKECVEFCGPISTLNNNGQLKVTTTTIMKMMLMMIDIVICSRNLVDGNYMHHHHHPVVSFSALIR